ncbi:hypothetical protein OROMI_009876 [Orobanche minor]
MTDEGAPTGFVRIGLGGSDDQEKSEYCRKRKSDKEQIL